MRGASEQKSARRYSTGTLSTTKPANNVLSVKSNAPLRTGKFSECLDSFLRYLHTAAVHIVDVLTDCCRCTKKAGDGTSGTWLSISC